MLYQLGAGRAGKPITSVSNGSIATKDCLCADGDDANG
jgi:hypothetical protein